MSARIRPMRLADVREVARIEASSFPRPWSEKTFVEELAAEHRIWLVVESSHGVEGYAGVALLPDAAHVLNIAVRAEAQQRGLGESLLFELMRLAEQSGAERATLEVRVANSAAISLYREAGFEECGTRPSYYAETNESALIMWTQPFDSPTHASRMAAMRESCEQSLKVFARERTACHVGPDTLILAIETSCDETAAAVLRGNCRLLSNVVASQVDFHARFGGVVPEIASRKHVEAIVTVVDEALACAGIALDDLSAIAVTQGPGLIGALVVGVAYAKGLALATGLPLVGVNHLEGHIFANVLEDPTIEPPLVALVVSGGHTSLVHVPEWGRYRTLGQTLDDAAGEAFDKVAKVLDLGYPGGPVLSKLAAEGDPEAIRFPRAMIGSSDYKFSLSGLKTAVINHIRHEREAGRDIHLPDLAASFQAAIIDVQVAKATRAVQETGAGAFCLAGGVAANPALRAALTAAMQDLGVRVSVPSFALCTDNAAMIAAAAYYRLGRGDTLGLGAEPIADWPLDAI